MNLKKLAERAVVVNDCLGNKGLEAAERIAIEKLAAGCRREAIPSHTLTVSLALAVAMNMYSAPRLLSLLSENLCEDGQGYLYFKGIRIAYREGMNRAALEQLEKNCLSLLGRGVVLTGSTVQNELLFGELVNPSWVPAVVALGGVWLNPYEKAMAFVLTSKEPQGKEICRVLSTGGFWRDKMARTNLISIASLLKSKGFAEQHYPKDYEFFCSEIEKTGITPVDLLKELKIQYLA